jgi:hypothetical protein
MKKIMKNGVEILVPENRAEFVGIERKTRATIASDEHFRTKGSVIKKNGASIYVPATNEGPERSDRVLRGIKGFSLNPTMESDGLSSGLIPPNMQEIGQEEPKYRRGLPREQIKVMLED